MAEDRSDEYRRRYLALLKDALTDRHYLENEVRLEYLLGLPPGSQPDPASLRDPARTLEVRFKRLEQARTAGRSTDDARAAAYTPYADVSSEALDHLERAVIDLEARHVPGAVVEVGVGRGGTGVWLRACLEAHGATRRTLWMVDPYRSTGGTIVEGDNPARTRLRADLNQVRDAFDRFDLFDDRTRFLQGEYEAALAEAPFAPIALARIGIDAAFSIGRLLPLLVPSMAPGSILIVEGLGRPVVRERFEAFRVDHGLGGELAWVDWDTAALVLDDPTVTPHETTPGHRRTPLAPPRAEGDAIDLSVVVVFYNMVRESARTLRSLSRSYQRGIGDLRYEVIAVDNGSSPSQRLQAADVAAYGPEFRLLTIDDASPSPTQALNRGIAAARGDVVAVMIDGAHVLTPGVFRHAMAAMSTYDPAIVAVQQWYVGPGQQGDAQQAGYDQAAEDDLFRAIRWPTDGYRLFEIGHFIGDRDWFDGIIESNCLFVPRKVLEQVGGFDDSFDMPGGGYANLELFERVHAHPEITPTSLLGEGTFHQFHGGTTTNVSDEAVRRDRVFSYGEHFRAERGRPLQGLNKPVHYIGTMGTKAARRTRSRREFLLGFRPDRDPVETTSAKPLPVPEELKLAAIEALWDQHTWRETTWLGHRVARYPTDLHCYQELLAAVRPAVTVWLGDDQALGGRALFSASIADQLGQGRVVAIGPADHGPRPEHPRISYLDGEPEAPSSSAPWAPPPGCSRRSRRTARWCRSVPTWWWRTPS
jgi:hypothetical protein